ncbi:uncharacterized protein LOC135103465 [Scylla paramamosain]|uniref:uncharacterized protein LOC135103465 n=1 Tax=Scylla paramamosain TaxID=85552 RepID=UPI003082EA51
MYLWVKQTTVKPAGPSGERCLPLPARATTHQAPLALHQHRGHHSAQSQGERRSGATITSKLHWVPPRAVVLVRGEDSCPSYLTASRRAHSHPSGELLVCGDLQDVYEASDEPT